jgi:hypothetical protein
MRIRTAFDRCQFELRLGSCAVSPHNSCGRIGASNGQDPCLEFVSGVPRGLRIDFRVAPGRLSLLDYGHSIAGTSNIICTIRR